LIQRVVDGDPLNRSVYPGLRAAGVLVRVAVPQVLIQNVQAVLTVMEGYDNTAVITAVKSALKNYINGLGISGDVIRNELIAVIMGVPGIYNCILTTPATDITMLDDQLARTTDSNLLIT
jgi:phage-related baseplate assembly protein